MRIGAHEYANDADDDVPKPAQSLGNPVPRQKVVNSLFIECNIVIGIKSLATHAILRGER